VRLTIPDALQATLRAEPSEECSERPHFARVFGVGTPLFGWYFCSSQRLAVKAMIPKPLSPEG
jgi:hypothetical protein